MVSYYLFARRGVEVIVLEAQVQKEREWSTAIMQTIQAQVQKRIITRAVLEQETFELPRLFSYLSKIQILRDIPGRAIGLGLRRVTVEL